MGLYNYLFYLILGLICLIISTKAVLNFNDVNYNGVSADRYNWSTHPCIRTCKANDKKVCNYVFVVEELSSMSKACYNCPLNITDCSRPHCIPANGAQKKIVVINRQLPGPSIEVCEQDTIVVDVRNRMSSQSTTVHWHGIEQEGTPYMDGVPFVTQCPIPPGDSFNYVFDATIPGTFFWHSHMGQQRHDGHFGNLIVNAIPKNNPHIGLYDKDNQRMIITDWINEAGDDSFIRDFQVATETFNATILINGLGPTTPHPDANGTNRFTPYAVFTVDKGTKYRFRLINSGSGNCPIQLSVDGHSIRVISLDSYDIKQVEVDALVSWPGERYDFVVNANQAVNNYWIRYKGYGRCQIDANRGVFQGAILRYTNAPIRNPTGALAYNLPTTSSTYRILNPYNVGTESVQKYNVSIPYLNAILDDDEMTLKAVADQQVYLSFDFYPLDNFDYHRRGLYGYNQVPTQNRIGSLQLNHISLRLQQFPLLSQYDQIERGMLCNASTINPNCTGTTEQCACTHVINVKLNSVVELVFVDEGNFINHPFHLHGRSFRVVAEENLNGTVTADLVKQMDREGKIKRRLKSAPIKDTMKTPGGGYSIVRFFANNPGYWFFHCHFEDHLRIGMALVFKVGEHKDFPKKPNHFPKCGLFTQRAM